MLQNLDQNILIIISTIVFLEILKKMNTFPSFYEVGNCSDSYNFLHGIINSAEMFNMESSSVSPRSMAEAKAVAANKSHCEAERRRRRRINGHLSTLRSLLPNTIKTDKASLLAEAVRCVRELKKTTAELGAMSDDNDKDKDKDTDDFNYMGSNSTMKFMFPSETDELKLSYCNGESGTIKAAFCCEDRPEMIMELRRALSTVEGKVIRAEMATVGGRIKCVLWVQLSSQEQGLTQLRRALKVVVEKANALPQMGQDLPGNKRLRLYQL